MEADLAETKVLLLEWAAFGIVRAFAESCSLFKSAFGSKFPDLRFVSRHENISADRSITEKWPGAISRSEAPLARLDARYFQKQRLRVGMIGPPRKRFGRRRRARRSYSASANTARLPMRSTSSDAIRHAAPLAMKAIR
jgi:hypothetical protein